MDKKVPQLFDTEKKTYPSDKPELSESAYHQWEIRGDQGDQLSNSATNSSILIRERTIKLPETHIFTPLTPQSDSGPVACEVVNREVSPIPDESYFPKITNVKEYHDVEYSLEPKKRIDYDPDFNDFQSAPIPLTNSDPLRAASINLLKPQKAEKHLSEIDWPQPGKIAQSTSKELDFLGTEASSLNFKLSLSKSSEVPPTIGFNKNNQGHSKPAIGTSPTQHSGTTGDDDFNDFQEAPPKNQLTKTIRLNDPITLSPARLVQSTHKSSWISSMDIDEITRFEAAFPTCKTEIKSTNEDWGDFVNIGTNVHSIHSQTSSHVLSNSTQFSSGDVDEWSDFVSVPPAMKLTTSHFQSKPKFSSWSQPIGKPYINHSTSFLTNQNQQLINTNHPFVTEVPRHSMTITNNFNYNFNHPEHVTGTTESHYQPKTNGISTILPELDFAMPKNLMSGKINPAKK